MHVNLDTDPLLSLFANIILPLAVLNTTNKDDSKYNATFVPSSVNEILCKEPSVDDSIY